jgi:hypothetical protein
MAIIGIHRKPDNSVGIEQDFSPAVISAMAGNGGILKPDEVERQIAMSLQFSTSDAQEFERGWEDFLAVRIGTPQEIIIRKFVEAIAVGGIATADEAIEIICARTHLSLYDYTSFRMIDEAVLPYHVRGDGHPNHGSCPDPACKDRYFRDAVSDDGTTITLNMAEARDIQMGHIRLVRNAELVKLDVPFMRAVEAGDTSAQATIATEKQVLRDIPATFDLTDAATPEALKGKWPAELPARE